MVRKVIWAESAWNDLTEAADYIAKDSHFYAVAFVREVKDASCSLTYFSERGRVVPEFNNPTIRELFVRNYRLIYQVIEQNVYILAFVHGARNLWLFWKQKK